MNVGPQVVKVAGVLASPRRASDKPFTLTIMARIQNTGLRFCALSSLVVVLACPAHAQDHDHDEHSHIHFSHPIITESPSPDTKVRIDETYSSAPTDGGIDRHTVRFEGEYAFSPGLSIELDVPFTILDPASGSSVRRLDNVEIGLKYANYSLAEHGVLIGGGIEFGLPTGRESVGIGSDEVLEIEPFVDIGFIRDRVELVAFAGLGFPTGAEDEPDAEFGWNASFLYHASQRVMPLLELEGATAIGGHQDGVILLNVTPGLKVEPIRDRDLQVGVGISVPVTDAKDFGARVRISVFYHI